jgi:hypothetical protein
MYAGIGCSVPNRGHTRKLEGGSRRYRKLVPGRRKTFACLNPTSADFEPLLATLHTKEHDVGDEQQQRCRDATGCRSDARWGRRSRNASHSPARQRRRRRAAAHPLSHAAQGQVAQGAGQGRRHARHWQGCRQRCDGRVGSPQHAGQYCADCGCAAPPRRAGHCAAR